MKGSVLGIRFNGLSRLHGFLRVIIIICFLYLFQLMIINQHLSVNISIKGILRLCHLNAMILIGSIFYADLINDFAFLADVDRVYFILEHPTFIYFLQL